VCSSDLYCQADKIPLVKNGLGMVLISTSQGVMMDYDARTKKLGGEILFKIF
jgi:small subunit ribosomal protein S8